MKPQGSGRIVVTASTAGLRADPMVCYGYIASKAAVVNVARQAALELAPHGVHVNVIAPGPIKTRIGGGVTPESERQWAALVPLGRMGEPEELKGLALLLASPGGELHHGRGDHDRRRPAPGRAGRVVRADFAGGTASPTIRNTVLTTGKRPCTVAEVPVFFRCANVPRLTAPASRPHRNRRRRPRAPLRTTAAISVRKPPQQR